MGVESENPPQRGQFLPDSPPHSGAMGQEAGKKWAAAAHSQPTIPKSDRLLVQCSTLSATSTQIVHEAVLRTFAGAGGRPPVILVAASALMAAGMGFSPATKLPRQPPRHQPAP
ncbi:hypothetical protein [Extensimonas sp. H3M7-6]|uniref:hypothetical protein n=1 Tax=Extensimonas soli TaxID=3031322 RepID=UPI0023DBBF18|nr:hypothetical protein [Extensimonas sp. H3M7-6]MDF1481517.1 hypothetical protein [Extensimonas sp. H3M7-6]